MAETLIENLGMILAMVNETMSQWMVMPANATGPMDTNIALTSSGLNVVCELANAAIGLSEVIAEMLELLI